MNEICYGCGLDKDECDCAELYKEHKHDGSCWCYDCYWARVRAEKIARKAQIQSILDKFIAEEMRPGNRWPYMDYARAFIGNALFRALDRMDE